MLLKGGAGGLFGGGGCHGMGAPPPKRELVPALQCGMVCSQIGRRTIGGPSGKCRRQNQRFFGLCDGNFEFRGRKGNRLRAVMKRSASMHE